MLPGYNDLLRKEVLRGAPEHFFPEEDMAPGEHESSRTTPKSLTLIKIPVPSPMAMIVLYLPKKCTTAKRRRLSRNRGLCRLLAPPARRPRVDIICLRLSGTSFIGPLFGLDYARILLHEQRRFFFFFFFLCVCVCSCRGYSSKNVLDLIKTRSGIIFLLRNSIICIHTEP